MNNEYSGPERRKMPLSDSQLEYIAERAAEKAVEKMTHLIYQEVGKGIVSRFFYLTGALSVAAYLWLKSKGSV